MPVINFQVHKQTRKLDHITWSALEQKNNFNSSFELDF